ncbi:MAG TPA: Asp-tRNA(Asn)/Glu-tRNA(Gln) amidotransferase subunit GatB [Acidobacteriota bacterium]|nr:Asp-tRNA(Asn)/Glu-tRNA(Gln) amidotransferase subunit GatB [Acidobacteriota bacterium]
MTLKVGLEIHGYIAEDTKLFCDCAISEEAHPNTNICPVCTGQPGSKPMLTNSKALEKAILIGLMLGCKINSKLLFQRKHYSWPDSPNNYQRTMSGSYASPVGEHGTFEGIRINEVHLEEDPAKWDPLTGRVDYNRAGTPLIEIVTEPDFTSAEQVREWLGKLITTLSYIKAINKTAGIKCDVNVSIAPKFERVEIKNVNSISGIVDSILFEQKRQETEVAAGRPIPMQTRTWEDESKQTIFMRSKESAQDYMFIPDPDIPYIDVSLEYISKLTLSIPEAPSVKEAKLLKAGLSEEMAKRIATSYCLIDAFETSAKLGISSASAGQFLSRDVIGVLAQKEVDLDLFNIDQNDQLFELLKLIDAKAITVQTAQKILRQYPFEKSFDVAAYVKSQGLAAVADIGALEALCKKAIDANPKAVTDYKAGNENSFNFLIGQVMRETKGAAKPDILRPILKKLLD